MNSIRWVVTMYNKCGERIHSPFLISPFALLVVDRGSAVAGKTGPKGLGGPDMICTLPWHGTRRKIIGRCFVCLASILYYIIHSFFCGS